MPYLAGNKLTFCLFAIREFWSWSLDKTVSVEVDILEHSQLSTLACQVILFHFCSRPPLQKPFKIRIVHWRDSHQVRSTHECCLPDISGLHLPSSYLGKFCWVVQGFITAFRWIISISHLCIYDRYIDWAV